MLERINLGEIQTSSLVTEACDLIFNLVSELYQSVHISIVIKNLAGKPAHILSKGISDTELNQLMTKVESHADREATTFEIGKYRIFTLRSKLNDYGFIAVERTTEKEHKIFEKVSNFIVKMGEIFSLIEAYQIDPITGLPGKEYLNNRIDEQIQRKIRYKEDFALVMLKLENYDEIFSTYTQELAQNVIKNIASFLRKLIRKSDVLARYDKDKFAILMPHTDKEGLKNFVARLKSTLTFETFYSNHNKISCNFEIGGIATDEINSLEHDEIILNAILAMESGKRKSGKDEKFSIEIIGSSPKMQKCKEEIVIAAQTDMTVLILGETGTGKELTARKIHELSPRREKPFVVIDCASIPDTLLESELFGHEKGAFTGATSRKIGLFESANGGTIFLDEIETTSPSMQAKLLRVIEEKTIRRVGGTELIPVDVRIISASNVDLEEEVKKGNFRKDLYYRLSGMVIKLPPLRERKEDIPELVDYFIKKISIEQGKVIKGVTTGVYEILQSYNWPGNVRELEKEVERMIAFTEDGGYITEDKISPKIRPESHHTFTLDELIENYEKNIIIDALLSCNWNETKASKLLGISRTNLIAKIKKYNIKRPENGFSKN